VDSISKPLRITLFTKNYSLSCLISLACSNRHMCMSNHTTLNLSGREGSERREKRERKMQRRIMSPLFGGRENGKREGWGGGGVILSLGPPHPILPNVG
jgi:hypothetical protein